MRCNLLSSRQRLHTFHRNAAVTHRELCLLSDLEELPKRVISVTSTRRDVTYHKSMVVPVSDVRHCLNHVPSKGRRIPGRQAMSIVQTSVALRRRATMLPYRKGR